MNLIVQKFGASSLATPELREVAVSRVAEAVKRGDKPVVVCSALGRAPDPYATDVLATLLGPAPNGPNRDLLMACGEAIAGAVFAEMLCALGVPAQAMTGRQAGILTDDQYGKAEIQSVDPEPVLKLIALGIVPVVTGFQGATRDGATTTLGRGGSDLTAVALADALAAKSVEIYTDVSGVMTADPRRIAGAHVIERVTQREMVELAGNGAKVMHHKAAELANATGTSYVVKGLRSNSGTAIDDDAPVDPDRPVSGLAIIPDVTFCRIIQGLTDDYDRADVDRDVLGRIAERGISIDMINSTDSNITISILVPADQAVRAEQALHDTFGLGRGAVAQ